ncbi:MAG: hypothetical protein Q8K36_06945 [Alphaproteobacteria bacterium]|nr:hypothetical protein [Alphaproteobacteria bacterium]
MKTRFYTKLLLTLSIQLYMASAHSSFASSLSRQSSCTEIENTSFTGSTQGPKTIAGRIPSSPLTPIHPNNGTPINDESAFTIPVMTHTQNAAATPIENIHRELLDFINISESIKLKGALSRLRHAIISINMLIQPLEKAGIKLTDEEGFILLMAILDTQHCNAHMPQAIKDILSLYDPEEGFWFSILTATADELYPYDRIIASKKKSPEEKK